MTMVTNFHNVELLPPIAVTCSTIIYHKHNSGRKSSRLGIDAVSGNITVYVKIILQKRGINGRTEFN
jgi:hypothetical protein